MGRSVLVTGGNRGIGLAIAHACAAHACAAHGDAVTVTHRGSGPPAGLFGVRCDVTSVADVDAAFTAAEAEHGPVEVVVSNAGANRDNLLLRMSEADFAGVVDANLTAGYRVAKARGRRHAPAAPGPTDLHFLRGRPEWFGWPGEPRLPAADLLAHARAPHSRPATADVFGVPVNPVVKPGQPYGEGVEQAGPAVAVEAVAVDQQPQPTRNVGATVRRVPVHRVGQRHPVHAGVGQVDQPRGPAGQVEVDEADCNTPPRTTTFCGVTSLWETSRGPAGSCSGEPPRRSRPKARPARTAHGSLASCSRRSSAPTPAKRSSAAAHGSTGSPAIAPSRNVNTSRPRRSRPRNRGAPAKPTRSRWSR
jgi:NAD(P)-dependent dehydrogenase (short-subunit alcohol dehydrogenase family)